MADWKQLLEKHTDKHADAYIMYLRRSVPQKSKKGLKENATEIDTYSKDDPEMLELRELIVYPLGDKYVIIGGNMRYRALKDLGYTEAPCKVLKKETPPKKIRAISIKDNVPFGENDWDILANDWDMEELEDWGMEIPEMNNFEEIPDNLDGEFKEKPFTIKVTAKNIEDFDNIQQEIQKIITLYPGTILSVSGGEL